MPRLRTEAVTVEMLAECSMEHSAEAAPGRA